MLAYTEVFKKVFPQYLAMGMTYEEFWNGDVELVKFYREAFRLKQQMKEQELWLQGVYFCDAITSCFADKKNPYSYPEEPRGFLGHRKSEKSSKDEKREADNRAKTSMEMFMVNFNRKLKQKGGEENGSECRNAGH